MGQKIIRTITHDLMTLVTSLLFFCCEEEKEGEAPVSVFVWEGGKCLFHRNIMKT